MDDTSPQSKRLNSLTWSLSQAAIVLLQMTTVQARQASQRCLVHLTLVALVLTVLALGGLSLPETGSWASSVEIAQALPGDLQALYARAPLQAQVKPALIPKVSPANSLPVGGPALRNKFYSASDAEVVYRQAQPHTEIPHRLRLEFITYTVQAGDTVQGIAITFGVEDTTIMWCNPAIEDMPDYLRIGQQVLIPPIDGVCHTVKEGDTLESIASKYKVETSAITEVAYNNLVDAALTPGMRLIVAGGEKPYVPKLVTSYTGAVPEGARGTGLYRWPATGSLTQGYWWGHRAIDIAAYTGAPIYAADGGFVSFAGWTDIGYGYLLIIDHANGFASYYAHLSGFYVTVGQRVNKGDLIAAMGSTGNSTGPHLHFEIRSGAAPLNPRLYLP